MSDQGGRGRGRSGRGGRGRGNQNRRRGDATKKKLVLPDDAVTELGENIYVINQPGQADKFIKTTEEILNYIQKTYKHGEDLKKALKDESEFNFGNIEPSAPTKIDLSTPQGFKYKLQMEGHYKREEQYRSNKSNAHALIYGQCTQGVKNQLQARQDWKLIQYDPIELLKALQEITHRIVSRSCVKESSSKFGSQRSSRVSLLSQPPNTLKESSTSDLGCSKTGE